MIHLAFYFYLLCKRVETQLFLLLPRAPGTAGGVHQDVCMEGQCHQNLLQKPLLSQI